MQTKKLIKAFRGIGFETELYFEDMCNAFALRVFLRSEPMIEIIDDGNRVDFLFVGSMESLDGDETAEIVKILYELVIKENEE